MFDEALDGFDDVPGIKPDSGENDPDQDRQQNKPADHRQRRTAEKTINERLQRSRIQGLSHRNPPGVQVGFRCGSRKRRLVGIAAGRAVHCLTLTTGAKFPPPLRYRASEDLSWPKSKTARSRRMRASMTISARNGGCACTTCKSKFAKPSSGHSTCFYRIW